MIVNKWRELYPGRCVVGPQDWDGEGDSVSVRNPQTGDYTEIHAVYFGDGCIIEGTNSFRADWPCPGCALVIPSGTGPTPTPPPPPVNGCSDPVTPKVDRFGLKPHNRWYDSTPQFYNRETQMWDGSTTDKYCDRAGFSNRLHCPARSECPGFKCEERLACEQVGLNGPAPKFLCEIGSPTVNSDNPFQARCDEGAWIRVCAADGKTGCTQVDIAR